eukprot:m.71442 g.71442  ORF g.71442 m.71442 type:complete len:50 (-) comp14216_c0_seq2:123-272(-)
MTFVGHQLCKASLLESGHYCAREVVLPLSPNRLGLLIQDLQSIKKKNST